MITDRSELRRILIAVVGMTSVQTNGAQTIQSYQVQRSCQYLSLACIQAKMKQSILYENLGFTPRKTLLMAGIFQVILVVGGLFNLGLVDRLGRKPLYLGGFVILSIILGAFAACTARFEATKATGMSTRYVIYHSLID